MPTIDPQTIRQGDRLALSRAMTLVENDAPESREVQAALFPHTGKAHLVGVTGAPGTGKSTLVNQLTKLLRNNPDQGTDPKVAIIAVDPTSPFTGGALLGDRIRMRDLAGDRGIFIRSMASRGALGGLAHKTAAFVTLLDGAGFDIIIIETVGAGQAEVDIAGLAHTVIVVEAPGLGDDIQAIKAGILEIADIIVVNKADHPGADNSVRALRVMLEMTQGKHNSGTAKAHHKVTLQPDSSKTNQPDSVSWKTPILPVISTEGKGINTLVDEIQNHAKFLKDNQLWQQKEAARLRKDLEALIRHKLVRKWQQTLDENKFDSVFADVIERKCSPIEAVDLLL